MMMKEKRIQKKRKLQREQRRMTWFDLVTNAGTQPELDQVPMFDRHQTEIIICGKLINCFAVSLFGRKGSVPEGDQQIFYL